MSITRRSLLRTAGLGGAAATLVTTPSATSPRTRALDDQLGPRSGRLREYWLAAESFWHNLVPNGRDELMGRTFRPDRTSLNALGYRAYTPDWGRPLPGDEKIGPNTGVPGPTIRAEVGDTVRIHLRNDDRHYRFPHSLHAHGLRYDPSSDGAWLAVEPRRPGTAVGYGDSYTYQFTALRSSVGTWPYHDHSMPQALSPKQEPIMEVGAELGLFGVIAVSDPAEAPVDREHVLVMHDLYASDIPTLAQDFDCFNGQAFIGNTPTFTAAVGERVRWRVTTLGKEFHVFHIHGHRWSDGQRHVDSEVLGPATTLTLDYVEDNPGDWLYHCHVTDHMAGGMVGRYRVTG